MSVRSCTLQRVRHGSISALPSSFVVKYSRHHPDSIARTKELMQSKARKAPWERRACAMRFRPVIFFVPVLTKELTTLERVQPRSSSPCMPRRSANCRTAGSGRMRPSWTVTVALRPSVGTELCSGPGAATVSPPGFRVMPEPAKNSRSNRRRDCRNRSRRQSLVQRPTRRPPQRSPSVLCVRHSRLPWAERNASGSGDPARFAHARGKVEYPVIQSTAFDVKPANLIRAAKKLELEGVIAKRKGSAYEPGRRSGAWVKYKINRSQEFVIGGYTVGIDPFDALIVGCYEGEN